MKQKDIPDDQKPEQADASRSAESWQLSRDQTVFVPAADEVARRAYFSYVNQGARPVHDVQHWLEAEADLIAERNLTRVHGFHNRT